VWQRKAIGFDGSHRPDFSTDCALLDPKKELHGGSRKRAVPMIWNGSPITRPIRKHTDPMLVTCDRTLDMIREGAFETEVLLKASTVTNSRIGELYPGIWVDVLFSELARKLPEYQVC